MKRNDNSNSNKKDKFSSKTSKARGVKLEKSDKGIHFTQKIAKLIKKEKDESVLKIMAQVVVPYLLAGFGMILAGNVLNTVKHFTANALQIPQDWPVFRAVPQFLVMLPALLGLKGNLEMTLTSRLSTQASLGTLSKRGERREMVVGNLLLMQAQSLLVAFLAALFAVCFGAGPAVEGVESGVVGVKAFLLMAVSAMLTASVASLFLGVLMVVVVSTSHHYHISPDNIATPIAGSLGDLVTITLLVLFASVLHHIVERSTWLILLLLLLLLLFITPCLILQCRGNRYTQQALVVGWVPILVAMVISSLGGLVLDGSISHYAGLALLQPLVNGIGGNLVGVHASRQATFLHHLGPPTSDGAVHFRLGGCSTCSKALSCQLLGRNSKRALQLLVAPGHCVFLLLVCLLHAQDASLVTSLTTTSFIATYLTAVVFQVSVLLLTCEVLVVWLWRAGQDPDSCALPYLTSLGDLLGITLLTAAFQLTAAAAA